MPISFSAPSPYTIVSGSPSLACKSVDNSRGVFNPLRPLKNFFLGCYKTTMCVWTIANLKVFYPDVPLLNEAPCIQGLCEKAAFLLGLNPTHPHISEFYLPIRPYSLENVKIPCTDYQITLPFPQFPVLTLHLLSDTKLNKLILKPHRNSGLFNGGPISYDVAFELLKKIFPNTEFSRENFLLTCGPEFTKQAHRQIIKALNGPRLDEIIALEGEKLIERWKTYSGNGANLVNVSKEMQLFTCAVIMQAIFGNSDKHKELCEAVNYMNGYLYDQGVGKLVKGDTEKYNENCKIFCEIINDILEAENVSSLPLFRKEFSLAQKQGLCLLMFFAGQETTAFALAHCFAELSLNSSKQEAIFQAVLEAKNRKVPVSEVLILKEFIDKQLLKIPPVNGVSRNLKEDSYISFKYENGKEVGKHMQKNERLLANFAETAKRVQENGSNPTYSDASVFGEGINGCIGKKLALKELYQLPAIILSQLELSTQEFEFKFKTKVSNQAEPFYIKVKSKA